MLRVDGVNQAVVVPVISRSGHLRLAAAYVGTADDIKVVEAALLETLPRYAVPVVLQHVGNIPLTANGKYDLDAVTQGLVNSFEGVRKELRPTRAGLTERNE
jgi:acyl-CoA synthetase (AMP-forming)/AMP-acid ligase II